MNCLAVDLPISVDAAKVSRTEHLVLYDVCVSTIIFDTFHRA